MKRRGITVLIGSLLLALLVAPMSWLEVPYVALGPGPSVDTLGQSDGQPVISVEGGDLGTRSPAESSGELRLVTVSVHTELTLVDALRGWLDDDDAVVPRELIYPPDKTEKEVNDANDREFKQSQSSAETAALAALGYPVEVTVTEVAAGFDAERVLKTGDVIVAIDSLRVRTSKQLIAAVRAKPAGTVWKITYRRGGEERVAEVRTTAGEGGVPRLGVSVEQQQHHPFTLKIALDRIGGPSAGLMFALGIVDKIQPEDLTGGLVIAGTGTIDEDGQVGPIGGIHQKLVAAKQAGAVAFLTPADNCRSAMASAPPGLPLVRVETLQDALDALQALREKRDPRLCGR